MFNYAILFKKPQQRVPLSPFSNPPGRNVIHISVRLIFCMPVQIYAISRQQGAYSRGWYVFYYRNVLVSVGATRVASRED